MTTKTKYPKYIIKLHYKKDSDGYRNKEYWLYKVCDVVLRKQNVFCMKNAACKRGNCPYCYSISLDQLTEHNWRP